MEYTEAPSLITALRRIEGQARGIQRMIEGGRPCDEVVRQISAMGAAADRLNQRLVASNLRACLSGAELAPAQQRRIEKGLRAVAELRS
jgi:CsoR family transcriptional regulator, copper-sensing transcriptional repressor